ncbi:MAG: hypothetical protein GX633_08125 [Clostridiales bacterium]|jgi:hypothetical protein|nr:hypothetical protein [Clostridiales bacterium]
MKRLVILLVAAVLCIALIACVSHDTRTSDVPERITEESAMKEAVKDEVKEEPKEEVKEEVKEEPEHLNLKSGDYTIVYPKGVSTHTRLAAEMLGEKLVISSGDDESVPAGEFEILVGETNRGNAGDNPGLYDYTIKAEGSKLVISGGCDDALTGAMTYLMRSGEFTPENAPADFSYSFDGADDREEYIADPDRFIPNWTYLFEVPEWMRDFEETLATIRDPDGRMIASCHRGDAMNYPENSIEALISCILMGADNIEMDARPTKDGVLVLLHDETLSRTTDCRMKKGKNGLPESEYLSDWTFEQVRQLCLLDLGGKATDYVIPTMEEALTVCCERTTIRFDKAEVWDWDTQMYPLIKKTEAYRSCVLNFDYPLEKRFKIREEILADSGYDVPMFHHFATDRKDTWAADTAMFKEKGITAIAWWNWAASSMKRLMMTTAPELEAVRNDIRIYVQPHILNGGTESYGVFDMLLEGGCNCMLLDKALSAQMYIAKNFTPTEY